jgi:hypothetical protein
VEKEIKALLLMTKRAWPGRVHISLATATCSSMHVSINETFYCQRTLTCDNGETYKGTVKFQAYVHGSFPCSCSCFRVFQNFIFIRLITHTLLIVARQLLKRRRNTPIYMNPSIPNNCWLQYLVGIGTTGIMVQ